MSCMRMLAATLAMMAYIGALPAAEFGADEIMIKAYEVEGGRDGLSRLSFSFRKPNLPSMRRVYTMAWKLYHGEGGVASKLLFFSEFPPDDRGKAFMGYVYSDGRADDHWIYLPELRMVRKMSNDAHRHHHEDDDFAHSVLTRADLEPRKPEADRHELMDEEVIEGQAYYVVVSVPKAATDTYPYNKTVRWISKDDFLTERIDFYGGDGKLAKTMRIKWKKIDDFRVWEQVVGEDAMGASRTVLDISDIRINLGLKDRAFSARSLRNGVEAVLR